MASLTHPEKVRRLFKTILRLHRGLPAELRILGDEYAKAEFKAHKDAEAAQTATFMREWAGYAAQLSKQLGVRGAHLATPVGQHLDGAALELFNEEQLGQLYELYAEAAGQGKR